MIYIFGYPLFSVKVKNDYHNICKCFLFLPVCDKIIIFLILHTITRIEKLQIL